VLQLCARSAHKIGRMRTYVVTFMKRIGRNVCAKRTLEEEEEGEGEQQHILKCAKRTLEQVNPNPKNFSRARSARRDSCSTE